MKLLRWISCWTLYATGDLVWRLFGRFSWGAFTYQTLMILSSHCQGDHLGKYWPWEEWNNDEP